MDVTNANGKVCYIQIPAEDVARAAEFYRTAFGWTIRSRTDGSTAFDDGVEVSGAFVRGRPAAREAGLLVYVMVADAEATLRKIAANGGAVVEPIHPGASDIVARFRDPHGNLMGIYQEKALAGERSRRVEEGRIMELSARNQLRGKISAVKRGTVVAEVAIQIEGGQTIVSTISLASVDRMKLQEGDAVTAFIKASEVIVGK